MPGKNNDCCDSVGEERRECRDSLLYGIMYVIGTRCITQKDIWMRLNTLKHTMHIPV